MNNIHFTQVPSIPSSVDVTTMVKIINDMIRINGFKNIIAEKSLIGNVEIIISNAENAKLKKIKIPKTLFNPLACKVIWAKFLVETTTLTKTPVIYKGSRNIMNQNEMLYWMLQHRFVDFGTRAKPFTYLLVQDIEALMSFIQYEIPVAFNVRQKLNNTYVVLSPWEYGTNINEMAINSPYDSKSIGDVVKLGLYRPSEDKWTKILKDLPIMVSSESSMSKTAKLTLNFNYDQHLFRSVGFNYDSGMEVIDGKYVRQRASSVQSIFPPKQNIVSRHKTHIGSEAYELINPSKSCFIQDHVRNELEDRYDMKDKCLRETIVIFDSMNKNTLRLVGGEIEASLAFVNTEVWQYNTRTIRFPEGEATEFAIGDRINADQKGRVFLGKDDMGISHYIYNCTCVEVINIIDDGSRGAQRIYTRFQAQGGNARLDSNTGIKGVTKCKPNLGYILFPDFTYTQKLNDAQDLKFKHWQVIDKYRCDDYQPNFKSPFEDLRIKPDLIVGMNATKAKGNTIALARAALAVKLGTYKPTHVSGLLNSMNTKEIQAASDSLPEFKYINEFGVEVVADIGICYTRFTELGTTYTKFKEQSFMFESGRHLLESGNEELFKAIWKDYIDPKFVDAIKEFQKILTDDRGVYAAEDTLPIYTIKDIFDGKVFSRKDLVTVTMEDYEVEDSKLLDENFNKGFYIDCRNAGGPLIRCPSAQTFNLFVTQRPNRMWIYPSILVSVSKMLENLFGDENLPIKKRKPNTGYLFVSNLKVSAKPNRFTSVKQYMNDIQTTLYSGEDEAQMMIQRLSKPLIKGFSMKQVVEPLLPDNVVCIFDDKLHYEACVHAYGQEDVDKHTLMYGLNSMGIRNPMLWESQIRIVKIWTYDDFAAYLLHKHKINIKTYLCRKENKDIMLISPQVAFQARSDSDGDLLPNFILKSLEHQLLVMNTKFNNISQDEKDWNAKYILDEQDVNDVLINPETGQLQVQKYELYTMYMHTQKVYDKSFNKTKFKLIEGYDLFLNNACTTKQAIGPSTNDGWKFTMLVQCYRKYHELHKGTYVNPKKPDAKPLGLLSINTLEKELMCFSYTRALQEFVVTAVKHLAGGSKAFDMFYLRNFHKSDVFDAIIHELVVEFKMPIKLAHKMIEVVSWANHVGLLDGVSAFLALYNKGQSPSTPERAEALEQWDDFIQKHTFFGTLLEIVYVIKNRAKHDKASFQSAHEEWEKEMGFRPSDDAELIPVNAKYVDPNDAPPVGASYH